MDKEITLLINNILYKNRKYQFGDLIEFKENFNIWAFEFKKWDIVRYINHNKKYKETYIYQPRASDPIKLFWIENFNYIWKEIYLWDILEFFNNEWWVFQETSHVIDVLEYIVRCYHWLNIKFSELKEKNKKEIIDLFIEKWLFNKYCPICFNKKECSQQYYCNECYLKSWDKVENWIA